jgi:sulfopyruvate decarboxylase TPP-binding subunit
MQSVSSRVSGKALIAAIKEAGVRFIVALPDRTTTENVLKPLLADPEVRVVQVCKEDEGVSICAGLHAAGQRAVLLMQYTGLLDSVNALRGVAMEGRNPVCMLVGLLQKEPGVAPRESKHYNVRIVEPVLDALQMRHELVESEDDASKVTPAIEAAYKASEPVVLLIGAEPRP